MKDERKEAMKAFARMAAKQAVKEKMKDAVGEIAEYTKVTHDAFKDAGFTDEQAFDLTCIMLETESAIFMGSGE